VKLRVKETLIAAAVLLAGRRRTARLRRRDRERVVPAGRPERGAETLAITLFLAAALCAAGFVAVYALDRLPARTQLFGATLGCSLLLVGAGLIVVGRSLVVTEEIEEDYPATEHREEQELLTRIVSESGSRLTRTGLFKLALAGAGAALGVAVITPLASLGPVFDIDPLYRTPWRRGRRLVDGNGRPYRASDIQYDDFYTAFAEGADKEDIASPVVLVRLPEALLHLPPENAGYAAHGIVAYSKICTHAGCAISLYRAPLFQPDEPGPALVCPCHYSTFDPATGGTVEFGPAGRKLPMLPLAIDRKGELRAAGNFDGPVGPSWWGVRMRKPIA
jgi:quinol---cytochrome c reductase iron-sulfur subunit